MTSTIAAPDRMSRREVVANLLEGLPRVDGGIELRIKFSDDSYPTTSFMDELVRQTISAGLAASLALLDADAFATDLAIEAALRYDVRDRLIV